MADDRFPEALAAAREAAWTAPLETLHPGRPDLFEADAIWPLFERLRREDPVHFVSDSPFGPYWSVTTWQAVTAVDLDHQAFSSAQGSILAMAAVRAERSDHFDLPMFMSMDAPRHTDQRRSVSPAFGPGALARLAPDLRADAARVLDALPVGEPFDWVERVSRELTAAALARLFGFPVEQRRSLSLWSDMLTRPPGRAGVTDWTQKRAEIRRCIEVFTEFLSRRTEPADDLVSLLAQQMRTAGMDLREALGNVLLLIVGGNDTIRNALSGSVLALSERPASYARLAGQPDLLPTMVCETLRWQTPLAHMLRTATRDVELGGRTIRKGDSVAMWYASANRDETVFDDPDEFLIDRPNARRHLAFGSGVHRCLGARLAELQLQIIWEEILNRFGRMEVVADPVRTHSVFVRGYEALEVVVSRRPGASG